MSFSTEIGAILVKVYYFKKHQLQYQITAALFELFYLLGFCLIEVLLISQSIPQKSLVCAASLTLGFCGLNGCLKILNDSLFKTKAAQVMQRICLVSNYLFSGSLLFYPVFSIGSKSPVSSWILFGFLISWLVSAACLTAIFGNNNWLFWILQIIWLLLLMITLLFLKLPVLIWINGWLIFGGDFLAQQKWSFTGNLIQNLAAICFLGGFLLPL